VAVPVDARIEAAPTPGVSSLVVALKLTDAVAGQKVSVWTATAPSTAEARAGAAGPIVAQRIVLRQS